MLRGTRSGWHFARPREVSSGAELLFQPDTRLAKASNSFHYVQWALGQVVYSEFSFGCPEQYVVRSARSETRWGASRKILPWSSKGSCCDSAPVAVLVPVMLPAMGSDSQGIPLSRKEH